MGMQERQQQAGGARTSRRPEQLEPVTCAEDDESLRLGAGRTQKGSRIADADEAVPLCDHQEERASKPRDCS
jgi:hypothetical protein